MSLFACCFWWFVLGFLLGWLANWLLARMLRRGAPSSARARGANETPAQEATATAEAQHEALVSAASAPPRPIPSTVARSSPARPSHALSSTICRSRGESRRSTARTCSSRTAWTAGSSSATSSGSSPIGIGLPLRRKFATTKPAVRYSQARGASSGTSSRRRQATTSTSAARSSASPTPTRRTR